MTPFLDAKGLELEGRLAPADFRMEAPELVFLIGPNGSGKTSFLHALAGIGTVRGTVHIEGQQPARLSPAQRKRLLSYLPASRDVAWPLTVRDLVLLGLPAGATDLEAAEAMGQLALEPFADRRVDRLSTGERSRALIARALAPKPRLLLLDEPVANLDPLWQLRLMEALRRAVCEGQGAVVAMHDLDMAGRFAGRLVLMAGGRMVADGPPDEVLASEELKSVFGVERADGMWRLLSPTGDRRSSP